MDSGNTGKQRVCQGRAKGSEEEGRAARKAVILLLLFLMVPGCMIGPNYKRPVIDIPGSWRVEEEEAKETADTRWWEQFNDPVLNGLIETALRENKDLKIASARVEEFLGYLQTTRAGLFPQVGAGVLGQGMAFTKYSNPPPNPLLVNPGGDFQMFLSSSWEIDVWGRLRRATQAARADLLSTEEGRRAVILTVVTGVALAYTGLRDLDKQLDIARDTVKSREHSLKLFQLRYGRGLISQLELSQIESLYQAAVATVPLLQKLIAQAENGLSVLLGHNPGPIPRGKALDQLSFPAIPAGLPSQLLERRPDIRQAEEDLIAANARIGVARAAYFPSISLTGLFGLESQSLSSLFTGPARMWAAGLPITGPIFTAGAIAGTVKSAEAIQQERLVRYEQVIQQAFGEVDDALIDQAKSREQLEAQRKQVEALRIYARLAWKRYENGYTSYLEVLDAERSLFDAELSYAQTQGNLFVAFVNLYTSMGGGWVEAADRPTGD